MQMMADDAAEKLPILGPRNKPKETAVYRRRWYVLTVFCLCNFTQALVWNTWGPIAESAEAALDWKDRNIGMLVNYGNIAYIFGVLPMCYFMDVKGLRVSLLICSLLIMSGTVLRCITLEPTPATWLSRICSILNGIGGTVPFAGPAALSSVWFPPDQRATATAVVSFSNYFGIAMSFIIGPQMVSSPIYKYFNISTHRPNVTGATVITSPTTVLPRDRLSGEWEEPGNNVHKDVVNKSNLENDIRHFLYLHGALGVLCFVLVLIYFPSRPPKPPSASACLKRTEYLKGLAKLLRNGSVWLVVIAYSLPTGILEVWQSVLVVNLNPLGISQGTAGYLGFWQTLAGCTSGLVIARFADVFMKRMKVFLIILFIAAVAASTWFFLLCEKYIPYNQISLYAACILIGVFVNGGIPLFYEIACEASYPTAEGVTGGFLTLANNMTGICFLFVMLIPHIGTSWMNEVLLGSTVLALPLLFVFPEQYRRTDFDLSVGVSTSTGDLQASVTVDQESCNSNGVVSELHRLSVSS